MTSQHTCSQKKKQIHCTMSSVILVLNCTNIPDQNIGLGDLDAQSLRYVQKDGIFTQPTPMSVDSLASLLKTDGGGYMHSDDVADLVSYYLIFCPIVPTELVSGHRKPPMVAEPVDSTALGNFYGTFTELSRGVKGVPMHPDSIQESVLNSMTGIRVPVGGLKISCNENESLSERLFSFIKELIYDNKSVGKGDIDATEILGKQNKDTYLKASASTAAEILHARRDVARAKKLKQTRKKNTIAIMFMLCITAFLWNAEARDYPGGVSQSANVISFEKEKPEDDARYLHCWPFAPTPALTSPAPINDNKKEKGKPADDALYLQCWLLAPAPPTSLAPNDDYEKVKKTLEDDAMHLQCQPLAPTAAPISPAPFNEKEKPKDDAMYLKCWPLAPTPVPTSPAHIDDIKKDNPKLLVFCGYPCCGFNIHGPCNRCCPKGGLHPPSPMTYVKEAGNGGGDGHGGGD